jgi:5-methylcytosine-specific restriction enzyme subunit McrC
MSTFTFFEHQKRAYVELGWSLHDPAVSQVDQLNQACGVELIHLGYNHLRATQFVGVVRVGETTLQILPKIDFEGSADAQTDSIPYRAAVGSATRNLLYLLSYTQDLQVKEQDVSPLLAQRSDWFELLTRLFAMNLHRLMKRGLERSYVAVEETLPVMRGRWLLDRQLMRRPGVKHVFDVAYDEFSADTFLNQVFKFVVECLLWCTQDSSNRRFLRDIREWLAPVQNPGTISRAHLEQVHFTRLNERFRPAFNLARLFIENSTMQLAAGRHHTFAFVFDMNRLFEEFVYRFLARYRGRILPQAWRDVRIRAQSRGKVVYLAEKLPDRQKAFQLVPDLLFTSPSGKPVLVIDTKYKQLDKSRRKLSVSAGDVYQMLAYATRLECPQMLLLYPQWARASTVPVEFETLGHRNHLVAATINLHQPLDRPDGLIHDVRGILEEVPRYGSTT